MKNILFACTLFLCLLGCNENKVSQKTKSKELTTTEEKKVSQKVKSTNSTTTEEKTISQKAKSAELTSIKEKKVPQKTKAAKPPTVEDIESFVRKYQDSRATHTFAQYEELLSVLSNEKFTTLPLNEYKDSIDNNKVLIGLRHDVDCHPFNALHMAKMEKKYNIKTTYFILATGGYYGQLQKGGIYIFRSMDKIYKEIFSLGHEIGIHNDLLVILIKYGIDPLLFNKYEIEHYNSINIPIYGTVAHGSALASQTVSNFNIFSDYCKDSVLTYEGKKYIIGQHSMKDYGFEYEANFTKHNKEYSDSGGKWNLNGGISELINKLKSSVPGDRIQILAHPVWYGK